MKRRLKTVFEVKDAWVVFGLAIVLLMLFEVIVVPILIVCTFASLALRDIFKQLSFCYYLTLVQFIFQQYPRE